MCVSLSLLSFLVYNFFGSLHTDVASLPDKEKAKLFAGWAAIDQNVKVNSSFETNNFLKK